MEQQQNKGKLEEFMAEVGRKLDQLLDKARQGAEDARFSEKMEELKQTKDKLEHELHEFVQDDEKWKEVQAHLQGAAQEIKKAFETTFQRKKNEQANANANTNNTSSQNTSSTVEGDMNTGNDEPTSFV